MNTWVRLFDAEFQDATWCKEQNAKEEKIFKEIFKGQEDKDADLWNVCAHIQMHMHTVKCQTVTGSIIVTVDSFSTPA